MFQADRMSRDSGVTLMEMMVALGIISVLFSMLTAGFVSLYRSSDATQATARASSSVSIAFSQLDRSVRYASAISEPGLGSDGAWFVEWGATEDGSPGCTQLRFIASSGVLQMRNWQLNDAGHQTGLTSWHTLAGDLSTPTPAAPPFARDQEAAQPHQQLSLSFTVGDPDSRPGAVMDFHSTFTALNSRNGDTTTFCSGSR